MQKLWWELFNEIAIVPFLAGISPFFGLAVLVTFVVLGTWALKQWRTR
jgi:hypothetical protein